MHIIQALDSLESMKGRLDLGLGFYLALMDEDGGLWWAIQHRNGFRLSLESPALGDSRHTAAYLHGRRTCPTVERYRVSFDVLSAALDPQYTFHHASLSIP